MFTRSTSTTVRALFARYRLSRYCRVIVVFSSAMSSTRLYTDSPTWLCGYRIGLNAGDRDLVRFLFVQDRPADHADAPQRLRLSASPSRIHVSRSVTRRRRVVERAGVVLAAVQAVFLVAIAGQRLGTVLVVHVVGNVRVDLVP